MRITVMVGAIFLALPVLAQAPVDDTRQRQDTLQRDQQRAGIAYRELQQAQYESKLAEQDLVQADGEYKAAIKRAEESKRRADAAKKAFDWFIGCFD